MLAAAVSLLSLAACARPATSGIAVAGDTRVDLVTVAAPRLTAPAIDVTVGIAKAQVPGGRTPASKVNTPGQASGARRSLPAGRLAVVTVRAGDTVRRGQVVAVFDDTLLRLGVASAEAAERRNAAGAGALARQASDLRDTRAQLRDQRAKLDAGLAQLQKGIAGVRQLESAVAQLQAGVAKTHKALAQLAAARAALAAKLADAKKAAASPSPPPGIEQVIAQLEAQIAGIDGQTAQLKATQARLASTLAGLQARLAQVRAMMPADPGQTVAQLQAGKAKIASGLSQLSSGIDQLEAAGTKVEAAQGIRSVAVEAARAALAQATLRAPCDGVVTSAMHGGEVAMIGAPVAVIRPAGGTLVDTYLTNDQLAGIHRGTSAEVTLDSVRGVLRGSVREVSAFEQFPPSNYPTQIVHLSRVVRVTVSVPETLPLGVPADVVIRPPS
jgi:X-X-X-Leu-X-X-Gly heptad repeat protein